METETQIALPLDTAPAERVADARPWPEKFTPALRRVLEKARAAGCVRRAGIYADTPQNETADLPGFDWQVAIDRCIAAGWLASGVAFNTYVLTKSGEAQLAMPATEGGEA
ncbi:hypothetical protein [Roseomonas xinghualingensis]|uniref:hypothetical protein n=1 Tax=Roseomonas xinghualingensis TaxID=2986475 RepID=UPI0021F0C52A|nr:hypothetical protein [Roseomonas sp. SXEYE001]MCV4207542.1 hypothetical protein [Roseomonas sp. SXEYE001]